MVYTSRKTLLVNVIGFDNSVIIVDIVLVASILTIAAPLPNPASAGQRPRCRYKACHKQTGLRRASER